VVAIHYYLINNTVAINITNILTRKMGEIVKSNSSLPVMMVSSYSAMITVGMPYLCSTVA
jgi:hypothetical protein